MAAPDIVREYGEAFRGDWSSATIDGRGVRAEMNEVARWIENPSVYPGDYEARSRLGLCLKGKGHWSLHCDEDCET